jgi:hypothetical protein
MSSPLERYYISQGYVYKDNSYIVRNGKILTLTLFLGLSLAFFGTNYYIKNNTPKNDYNNVKSHNVKKDSLEQKILSK